VVLLEIVRPYLSMLHWNILRGDRNINEGSGLLRNRCQLHVGDAFVTCRKDTTSFKFNIK
jgi:hypothetical protein